MLNLGSFAGIGDVANTVSNSLDMFRYDVNVLQGMNLRSLLVGGFPHKKTSGARIKGVFVDAETGERYRFQYNPQTLEHGRTANYAEVKSPGQQYPLIYFVNGNAKDFDMELFLYERPARGKINRDYEWFESFLPKYSNKELFSRPHPILISYGGFVAKCVVTGCKLHVDEYDENGEPYMAHINLSFKVVDMPSQKNSEMPNIPVINM